MKALVTIGIEGLLLALFPLGMSVAAHQRQASLAARIVVIKPKEGMQKQFEEGYKRHLEWHRRNKDTWTWYGWQIIAGDRLGYFMDGTFGHRWEDFDAPVSPAEDAADNAANVTPYADFLSLGHYALRPDISRGSLLEDRMPSPFLELLSYHIRPGREAEFEALVRKSNGARARISPSARYTWYQLINGGEQSTYILLLPLNKLSELQFSQKLVAGFLGESNTSKNARRADSVVGEVRSETLRYRADMSYFPGKE